MPKPKRKNGKVCLVGAGPGDPGLITVKGLECIKKADVILYDRLIPKALLARAKRNAILKYTGKEKGDHVEQGKINQMLLKYSREGKCVVRLKGGDPFIFGRGQEEMDFLEGNGIDCEVIPGVSSCYAVPEVCGIPLTQRTLASEFLVVTGHEDPLKEAKAVDWEGAAKFPGTIVIMMGLSNFKEITAKLISGGKDINTPAAVISRGTAKKQQMVLGTLSDISDKARNLSSPAVCVIGDVVRLGYKPLAKKRYLSTASERLNRDIAEKLTRLGAAVDLLPLVRIVPNKDTALLDSIIKDIKSFDWLVFTSRHGVYYFLKRYFELKADITELSGKIACVGSGTAAEFAKYNISVDLMPLKFTTLDLARTMVEKDMAGKRIALLRTKVQRDDLKNILRESGAEVTDCIVYAVLETKDTGPLVNAIEKRPDGIFFLSPKSADTFFGLLPGKIRSRIKSRGSFYSIGPVTTQALKAQGVKRIHAASEHTTQGLVDLCLEMN